MNSRFRSLGLWAAFAAVCLVAVPLDACTRCVYLGSQEIVIVARSMDWAEDPGSNLYVFPRGLQRSGAAGANSIAWTSKYGSVITAFYEAGTVDGMNDQGLVANVLYLVESNYGTPTSGQKTLSICAWGQYVLDNYATVAEAVESLRKEPFAIVAPILPNGEPAQGHLSVSDPSGDSAIFEYVDGKLQIHHGRQYQVMTNSPTYDKQLSLNAYWQQIGGTAMLPGTSRAADRFVRASFYIDAVPEVSDMHKAVASVFSVIRGVSVPLGITTPGQPNIASTVWRTLYDQKNKVMYFDSATSPTVFWVPLSDLDFKVGAPVKKLELAGGKTYSGNAADKFAAAKPFEFLPAVPK
ncbi:linear amide C-N hydrolase [Planctomicrobium piriforme]|uniref:Choloylglycine hydrolase n=1 Tax=Planctomicrobium piriforme TaxID=1576369 RepID=A0A1I3D7P0_9PLAN|nr:linear amide C-N hydrolase [Planctomicrobium piriforme]SFH82723.1 choloylglycine hydrolase [Planctomicrobium piriforme]